MSSLALSGLPSGPVLTASTKRRSPCSKSWRWTISSLIEYGLQSIHDRTLEFINRGHDYDCFKRALAMTAGRGIKVGAHLILGFPTETRDDMLAMADELSGLPLGFLKLHQLQVIKDTALADLYAAKPFATLGYEEYIALVADFLELLSPDIVLQRLFAAAPR